MQWWSKYKRMNLWTSMKLNRILLTGCSFQRITLEHTQTNKQQGTRKGTQPTQKRKLHICAMFYCGERLPPFCISRLQPNSNREPTSKWPPSSFQRSLTKQFQYGSWCTAVHIRQGSHILLFSFIPKKLLKWTFYETWRKPWTRHIHPVVHTPYVWVANETQQPKFNQVEVY